MVLDKEKAGRLPRGGSILVGRSRRKRKRKAETLIQKFCFPGGNLPQSQEAGPCPSRLSPADGLSSASFMALPHSPRSVMDLDHSSLNRWESTRQGARLVTLHFAAEVFSPVR